MEAGVTTQKRDFEIVIVCVKGGGRGACAMEREWLNDAFGPQAQINEAFGRGQGTALAINCPVSIEVWNYNGGQIAKKFGLDPEDYDVEDTE